MNEDQEITKYEKVKNHLRENKRVYAAAVSGVVAGSTVVGVIMLRHAGFPLEINQTAKNTALIVWKPTTTQVAMVKKACPDPIPVRDKLTGMDYPSLNQAAKGTGELIRKISEDAQGLQERFERLPDSVFA